MSAETRCERFDWIELSNLHREMTVRIVFQNAILVLQVVLFFAVALLQVHAPAKAGQFAFAFGLTGLLLAAMWCHHGARQAQIKTYLLILEERYRLMDGWESWLPKNRIGGRLGSRWFISTKGLFMATIVASVGLGIVLDASVLGRLGEFLATALAAIAIGLLLSNPKEGLNAAARPGDARAPAREGTAPARIVRGE